MKGVKVWVLSHEPMTQVTSPGSTVQRKRGRASRRAPPRHRGCPGPPAPLEAAQAARDAGCRLAPRHCLGFRV
ncbi:hypothetical protein T484DRAFT_1945116 [Baffinella frigidus]|nr:hypothetical protein T484DRAFT_1945116 [Cryptophyta sp. CCMP2293]